MPTAYARIETDRPSRYLVQLCRHADQMRRMRHRPPTGHSDGRTPPDVRHVDYSETHGVVRFAEGQWTLQATADALTLHVDAADEDTLWRLQEGIAFRLGQIGRRDRLAVTWQQPPASTAPPGDVPAPDTGTGKRRWGRLTAALAAGAAVVIAVHPVLAGGVIAVHLGLGGAALAGSAWTGWAISIVLAIILLKLMFIAAHVVLGGFLRDRRCRRR